MSRAASSPSKSCSTITSRRFDAALVLALLTVTFLFGCFEMWNVDIWWHLRTGQLIAERMTDSPWPWHWVPERDWYTFTHADKRWIDLHWGFQLAAAAVHRFGGVPGLVLWKAALGVSAVGICLSARRREWSTPVIVGCWLPALVVLSGRLYVRPEIFTLVYLATFLTVLFHAERRPRLLWLLPPVQLLWVNSQGLFIFGPIVLACYWLDWLVKRLLLPAPKAHVPTGAAAGVPSSAGSKAAMDWQQDVHAKPLLGATLLALAACFANPYTWRGAVFPLELYRRVGSDREFYSEQVEELQGVGDFLRRAIETYSERGSAQALLNPYLLAHLATLFLGGASFVLLALATRMAVGRWRLDVFRLLAFAGFAYLGWQARRNNNHFALVAGFVTAANCAEAAWRWNVSRSRARRRSWTGRTLLILLLAGLAWFVVSDRFYAWAGAGRRFGLGQRRDWYPHGAAAFAARDAMPLHALVIPWGHASSYIYHNAPRRRVFMDGRLEVNARATIERFNQIVQDIKARGRDWEKSLRAAVQAAGASTGQKGPSTGPAVEAPRPATTSEMPAVVIGRHSAFRLEQSFRNDRAWLLIDPLLRNSRWRCVYCDRTAAVFIETDLADRLGFDTADLRPMYQPMRQP